MRKINPKQQRNKNFKIINNEIEHLNAEQQLEYQNVVDKINNSLINNNYYEIKKKIIKHLKSEYNIENLYIINDFLSDLNSKKWYCILDYLVKDEFSPIDYLRDNEVWSIEEWFDSMNYDLKQNGLDSPYATALGTFWPLYIKLKPETYLELNKDEWYFYETNLDSLKRKYIKFLAQHELRDFLSLNK